MGWFSILRDNFKNNALFAFKDFLEMLDSGPNKYIENMKKSANIFYSNIEEISKVLDIIKNPETLDIFSEIVSTAISISSGLYSSLILSAI